MPGGVDVEADFCAVPQTINFLALPEASVAIGLRTRLLAGHLPQVVAGNEAIGNIVEPHATAMRHCIEEGYSMLGSVQSIDIASRQGTLRIEGSKPGD